MSVRNARRSMGLVRIEVGVGIVGGGDGLRPSDDDVGVAERPRVVGERFDRLEERRVVGEDVDVLERVELIRDDRNVALDAVGVTRERGVGARC